MTNFRVIILCSLSIHHQSIDQTAHPPDAESVEWSGDHLQREVHYGSIGVHPGAHPWV